MAAPTERSRSNRRASTERVRLHIAAAAACAERIAQDDLSERQRRSVLQVFRRVLLPKTRPRRWRKNKLTRACEDYAKGLRGTALYSQHIAGWSRLSQDSRTVRSQRLLKSIRRRQSRAKRVATKQALGTATKPLE